MLVPRCLEPAVPSSDALPSYHLYHTQTRLMPRYPNGCPDFLALISWTSLAKLCIVGEEPAVQFLQSEPPQSIFFTPANDVDFQGSTSAKMSNVSTVIAVTARTDSVESYLLPENDH